MSTAGTNMRTFLAVCCCLIGYVASDKACPYKPADLIFVLDGSGSEGQGNFQKQLQFVANFTSQFEVGLNNTRVALVTFATTVKQEFALNKFSDNETTINHILSAHYPNGETNTHLALREVRRQTLDRRHGAERNVSKIVIVLTDGQSLEPGQTKTEADMLKRNPAVTVIAIGIGSHVDPTELSNIASDGNHTFRVATFDALKSLQAELTQKTCKACNDMSDICFVLDSSGSEGAANFHKQLEFINMIVNEFSYGGQSHTQVCVVTFSTYAQLEMSLFDFDEPITIMENILKIPFRDGETYTDQGINMAAKQLSNRIDNGARSNANKVMIILTDGRSTEPRSTQNAATHAHREGIETYTVGIGNHVDPEELIMIASDRDHAFTVSDFDMLESIHQQVVDNICAKSLFRTTTPEPTTVPTTPTTTLPPTTTKAACGLKPADIVFVLDSSDSEGAENFQKEVEFVYNFASQFSIGTNNVQFSVVTFSSEVKNNFYFNDYNSRHDVLQAIANNVTYMGQGTNTSGALHFVREYSLDPHNGARDNSSKFVIVITDGRSDNPVQTKLAAENLKSSANVISIGVGPSVDRTELGVISSNHRVLTVDNFALLKTIRNQLTDLACSTGN